MLIKERVEREEIARIAVAFAVERPNLLEMLPATAQSHRKRLPAPITSQEAIFGFYRNIFSIFTNHVRYTGYSHSIVPMGLGVRSMATRQIPGTSARMRSAMRFMSAQSNSGTVAVMASTVLTARMIAGHS